MGLGFVLGTLRIFLREFSLNQPILSPPIIRPLPVVWYRADIARGAGLPALASPLSEVIAAT